MSVNDALRMLFPIELGGDHEADLRHDSVALDAAQAQAATLLIEMHGDSAATLLLDWERVFGVLPEIDDPLQLRREKVVQAIKRRGGLSIPYFLALAEAMGYEISIVEPVPFMAGWGEAGQELFGEEIVHQWGVSIANQPLYYFRAGESAAGERLLWWDDQPALEELFRILKPAHTYAYFIYGE